MRVEILKENGASWTSTWHGLIHPSILEFILSSRDRSNRNEKESAEVFAWPHPDIHSSKASFIHPEKGCKKQTLKPSNRTANWTPPTYIHPSVDVIPLGVAGT